VQKETPRLQVICVNVYSQCETAFLGYFCLEFNLGKCQGLSVICILVSFVFKGYESHNKFLSFEINLMLRIV
jgi:hypothetical protein